jgi:hypothetical protein
LVEAILIEAQDIWKEKIPATLFDLLSEIAGISKKSIKVCSPFGTSAFFIIVL